MGSPFAFQSRGRFPASRKTPLISNVGHHGSFGLHSLRSATNQMHSLSSASFQSGRQSQMQGALGGAPPFGCMGAHSLQSFASFLQANASGSFHARSPPHTGSVKQSVRWRCRVRQLFSQPSPTSRGRGGKVGLPLVFRQGAVLTRDAQPFNREDVPRQAGSRLSSQTLGLSKIPLSTWP